MSEVPLYMHSRIMTRDSRGSYTVSHFCLSLVPSLSLSLYLSLSLSLTLCIWRTYKGFRARSLGCAHALQDPKSAEGA